MGNIYLKGGASGLQQIFVDSDMNAAQPARVW